MNHQVHKFEQELCNFISSFCKYISGNKKKKRKEKVAQNHKTGVSETNRNLSSDLND